MRREAVRGRTSRAIASIVLLTWVLAIPSPSSGSASPASARSSQARGWSIAALGDSVPDGNNCHCTPYPLLTAKALAVKGTNDAVSGATTSSVLRQLQSDRKVIDHVRAAHVVEIEIGANDVGYSKACGTAVACYQRRLPGIKTNLGAIVARVHALATDRQVLVVLIDYWSTWLGGKYAAARGHAYVAAAARVTADVNGIIKSTAASSRSAYVDLRAAFKGPSYAYDETHYLSNDGDHPNAAGHKKIAAVTVAVIKRALHI
jgi:acyl-CoA thioesterase-1